MTADLARQILAFALERTSYDDPMPEDDEMLVSEAERLVRLAAVAWNHSHARGPEVEGVLRIANPHFDGTGDFSPNGNAPDPKPEPVLAQAPPGGGDEPPAVPETLEEEPEPEPIPEPQPAPAPEEAPVDAEEMRANQEPWIGYDGDSVQTVNNALDAAAAGNGGTDDNDQPILLTDEQIDDLLAHVWAYESAHKKRAGVINHLGTLAEQRHPQIEDFEPEPEEFSHDGQPKVPDAPPEYLQRPADSPPPEKGIDYTDLIREVEADLARERIHTPAPPEGEPVVLPYEIAQVSDKELRDLHHAFGAYAYYADYRVQRHEAIAQRARQQADEIVRELLLAVVQYDERNHERRMTFITAEVESSPHVVALRSIQRRHEVFAEAARRERDGYHKTVEFLSRQETMRHNEWERANRR